MSPAVRSLATLFGAWFVAHGAFAETPVPIKPGLWQVTSQTEVNGQKAPDPTDQLASLPPEARAKIQAMMKERGVAMDNGGGIKICHTRQSLEKGMLQQNEGTSCKTELLSRTSRAWKWHTECTQPAVVSDGEAVFESPESYTVTQQSSMQRGAQPQAVRSTIKAKWLAADCGDVKPLQLPAMQNSKPQR